MKKCRICAKPIGKSDSIILKNMPPSAQGFTKRNSKKNSSIDYFFGVCNFCCTPQILNRPVSYYKKTIRTTSLSKTLLNYRKKQFKNFISNNNLKNKKLLEVGCNKGENLKILKKFCHKIYGVEFDKSSVEECKKNKLRVSRFYLDSFSSKIHDRPFDAFIILNFMEHIPNLKEFFINLKKNLNKNYVGLIEVPNFEMIKKKGLYTEIILDHLYYFSKENLSVILDKLGLSIIKKEKIFDEYILSLTVKEKHPKLIYKKKKNCDQRKFNVNDINKKLNIFQKEINLFRQKINNKKFIIWGAGHQSLMICSYYKLNDKVKFIIDSSKMKQNKYAPGSNIKIFNPSKLKSENEVSTILVIGGGYSKEIAQNIRNNFKSFKIYIANKNKIINF